MASDDHGAPINRLYDKPVEYVPVARHLLFSSNLPLVNPPDEGRRFRPIYIGCDPAADDDKTSVVWIDEAGEIVAADAATFGAIEASYERALDRVDWTVGGHLGKTQMRFRAAMEAIVREMVVKPLLRAVAPQPLPVPGHLIRTASASYPAALLQPETQGV